MEGQSIHHWTCKWHVIKWQMHNYQEEEKQKKQKTKKILVENLLYKVVLKAFNIVDDFHFTYFFVVL